MPFASNFELEPYLQRHKDDGCLHFFVKVDGAYALLRLGGDLTTSALVWVNVDLGCVCGGKYIGSVT